MAAEKLTTGRLIQILVVMAVLIGAFIWRTFDYSSSKRAFECKMISGACQLSLSNSSVKIELEKQSDKSLHAIVTSPIKPQSLYVQSGSTKNEFEFKNIKVTGNNRAYLYALSDNVKYRANDKMFLIVDQDQIEINF